MRITIIINPSQARGVDLQVNEDQKIEDTLEILGQAGILPQDQLPVTRIYSERRKQFYNTRLTYRQAMIWNGDRLVCR